MLRAWVVGLLGTLLFFRAQFASGFDQFFGNRSDSRFILYLCEHWYRAFQGQAEWLSPGMFYPVTGVLGRSDMALGLALPYSVLRFCGLEPFLALELTTILLTVLAYALTVWLLVRVLGLGPLWGSLGAAFFTFNSAKLALSYHLQLQFVAPLPLIFGCVVLASRAPSRWRAFLLLCGAGLAWDLLAMTSFYLGWFCLFWGGLYGLFAFRRLWLPALGALVVTGMGLTPLLVAYLPVLRTQGTFGIGEVVAPQWWSFLAMGDGNYLWGWLTRLLLPAPRPHGWEESTIGLGLVVTLAWALLTLRGRALVLLTSLILVLNMQYGRVIPLSSLTHHLPGGGAIRVPTRWMVFLALPMAIALAGAGQRSRRPRLALALATLALGEQLGVADGYSIQRERAYLESLIRRLPTGTTAFYVDAPWWDRHVDSDFQTDAMMVSVLSGVPTLNGWTSRALENWYLREFRERPYEALVKGWVGLHRVSGPVVRLELTPPVEAYGPHPPAVLEDVGLPPNFVRVRGGRFEVEGKPYRFVGANLWYAMNLAPDRLVRELDRLQALGVSNVRVLAASEGPAEPRRLVPALQSAPDIYSEELLVGLDRLLAELARRRMRAVLVLCNAREWSGGVAQYLRWNGLTEGFYTNDRVFAQYERMLKKIVGRTNTLTRVPYREDPTIMSWELLAEPPEEPGRMEWFARAWRALRAADNSHLVADVDYATSPDEARPVVLGSARAPRDGGSCEPSAPTTERDRVFASILKQPVSGVFFWAWAGEGRPREAGGWWKPGDPFTGDPPDVPQGLDSVYDTDVSTARVILEAAKQ